VSSDPAGPDSEEGDITAVSPALIARIRTAYEQTVKRSTDLKVFPGEKSVDPKTLKGEARQDYNEYEDVHKDGGLTPIAKVATVSGTKIYMVFGSLSDTGDQFGFYDAHGKALALAYSGQGEHPNANGVDWVK
jgi:hypothetical protein